MIDEELRTSSENLAVKARELLARASELSAHSERIRAECQESAAASKALAVEAMERSAQTSRNLDRLEKDIADLQQMMGIVVSDSRANRGQLPS